ncbi:hypothetical protein PS15m_005676 [Mucor circinelloides]
MIACIRVTMANVLMLSGSMNFCDFVASSAKERNGIFEGLKPLYLMAHTLTRALCLTPSPAALLAHLLVTTSRTELLDPIWRTLKSDRQKEFIVDLATFCKSNTQLWTVFEYMDRDINRVYAEISVSPAMHKRFPKNPTLQLEIFAKSLMACPTLSPSANVIKLSLTRLSP